MNSPIRVATRSSELALWQARHVADLLRAAAPEVQVELVEVSTVGDRDQSEPLRQFGGLGVFTREVQRVVLQGDADLAVHSLKDLPTESAPGLVLAGIPERGPEADTLVLPSNSNFNSFSELPSGAVIGTGSLRRQAQLLHQRPGLKMTEIRGNVGTRLGKLDSGQYDALILAEAGLRRLGLATRITQRLTPPLLLPAVGQGALGIECREDDERTIGLLQAITHQETRQRVLSERALLAELRAGCHAPLGARTAIDKQECVLEAVLLSADGSQRIQAERAGRLEAPVELGRRVAADLLDQGAASLIATDGN